MINGQIFKSSNYSIHELNTGTINIFELSKFIVIENYNHHHATHKMDNIEEEIKAILMEEVLYAKHSKYYIAYDSSIKMIGTIRIMKWDKQCILPIQEKFHINPLTDINCLCNNSTIWHIGRFAISSSKQIQGITLFKQLLVYALTPLYENIADIIIAECDSKLVRVLSALGIEINTLGKSHHYLGSETVPLYLTHNGIVNFYEKHKELVKSTKV